MLPEMMRKLTKVIFVCPCTYPCPCSCLSMSVANHFRKLTTANKKFSEDANFRNNPTFFLQYNSRTVYVAHRIAAE